MRDFYCNLLSHIVPKKNAHRISRYRSKKTGKHFIYRTKEAQDSESFLAREIKNQLYRQGGEMLQGKVFVRAKFKKTRADCIGLMETLLDAMQGIVYKNDRQVVAFFGEYDARNTLGNAMCQLYVCELDEGVVNPLLFTRS